MNVKSFLIVLSIVAMVSGCNQDSREIRLTSELTEAVQKYDRCFNFYDGMAAVIKGNKYGYINEKGEEIVPVQYEYYNGGEMEEALTIRNYSDGLVAVGELKLNEYGVPTGKWGFMDKEGKLVIPFQYDNVSAYSEGLCIVNGGQYIDKSGNVAFEKENSDLYDFHDGLALVCNWNDGSRIFVDKKGNNVLDCSSYSQVRSFHDGLAYVEKWDEDYQIIYKGFINKEGEEVIDCAVYEIVNDFSEGLAAVYKEGKWGFINTKGDLFINCEHEGFYGEGDMPCFNSFFNGLCHINSYYIDKNNKKVLKLSEEKVGNNFSEGLSVVSILCGDKFIYGYMDKQGNETFSENDYAELEAYKQKVKEEEEERIRQEEENRILGKKYSIIMRADACDGQFSNKWCNVGDVSFQWDRLESKRIRVPKGKVLIFKHFEQNSKDVYLDYIRIFVYDRNGNSKTYDVNSCGEFPILEGESFRIYVHISTSGRQTEKLEMKFHFREKDIDQY